MASEAHSNKMYVKAAKLKVGHVGPKNAGQTYGMEDCLLESNDPEKNLGVIMDKQLNVKSQCDAVAKWLLLGCIKKGEVSRSWKMISSLRTALGRPILQQCARFWCPHFQKDV